MHVGYLYQNSESSLVLICIYVHIPTFEVESYSMYVVALPLPNRLSANRIGALITCTSNSGLLEHSVCQAEID